MIFYSRPVAAAAGFVLLVGLSACSQTAPASGAAPRASLVETAEATPEETGGWPHDGSDIAPDPAVLYGRLENGMGYIILENETPTGVAALRMRVDHGSTSEADDQSGLAHFLEHMAFNGSENVPEGEMVKILERFGLAFGPDTNAFTSFNETQYQLDLPSTDEELIDTGLFLMRETASNLTLSNSAIDKERGVIIAEERLRNSFGLRRLVDYIRFVAPETILADRLPIGDLDVVANAPRERFVEYYRDYYRPETTTLVVVGDIDAGEIEGKIKTVFADWAGEGAAGGEPALGGVDTTRATEAGFFYDPDVPTIIAIAAPRPAADLPDTAETRRLSLLRRLGNGIVSRRLAKLSRAEDAPFLAASANFQEFFGAADLASLDITARPETWRAALALGEQELRRALEYGFTQSELNEQIANTRTALENAVAQAPTRPSSGLAAALASSLESEQVFSSPASSLERFNSYASDITPEAVYAAFRAQWDGVEPLVHVSNNVEIDNAETEILAALTESRQVAVAPPEEAGRREFAYTDFGPPGAVASDTRIDDLGVRTIVFDNNVRLNLKPTDFEEGAVRVSLRVGAGALEIPGEPEGLNFVMGGFFGAGGLEAHSLDDLQTILAGRTVVAGFGSGGDSFGGVSRTTPQDLELQLQVWAAYMTAPGYRPEADAQYRQTISIVYPTLDAEPSGILNRDVDRLLRDGDVRFGFPTEDVLLERRLDELKPVLERALTEGAIEIAIVGDIEEDAAIEAVARTFGALPERRADPLPLDEARDVSFREDRTPLTLTHAGPENKALALTYWPTTDDRDFQRDATLNLIRAVMRLKLTDELRETLGATYSPQAQSNTSSIYPGFGYLAAISEVEPGDVDAVLDAVDRIAADMADGGVTDDELQRARQPILENIEEARENNGAWLAVIDTAQTQPDRLDRFRTAEAVYRGLEVDDLTRLAAEYLVADKALRIRIVSDKLQTTEE